MWKEWWASFYLWLFVLSRLTLTGTELMVFNLPAELAENLLNIVLGPLFISGTSVKMTIVKV